MRSLVFVWKCWKKMQREQLMICIQDLKCEVALTVDEQLRPTSRTHPHPRYLHAKSLLLPACLSSLAFSFPQWAEFLQSAPLAARPLKRLTRLLKSSLSTKTAPAIEITYAGTCLIAGPLPWPSRSSPWTCPQPHCLPYGSAWPASCAICPCRPRSHPS